LKKSVEVLLKEGAGEIGVLLTRKMIEKFLVYMEELKDWNRVVNLTSLKKDDSIAVKHFIDSLSLGPHLLPGTSLLDLGSGAGFPGIPVKIAKPSLKVTLLEATRKKVHFQQHLIRKLCLVEISALQGRAENLKTEKGITPKFDVVTSRAFSGLEKFLRSGVPFIKKEGCLIAMKGKRAEEELEESRDTLKALSLEVSKIVNLQLPVNKEKRCLIFINKS
jgi:16S rRNA (guanine527-N7)-methyltransferase